MKIVKLIAILRKHQRTIPGYTAAFLIFVTALLIRELVEPYVSVPYVTLFPMMVLCSLVGGREAGIVSAVVGGIAAWYLWLPPRATFQLEWPTGPLAVVLYVFTSTILLLIMHGLNESLQALEKERDLSSELFRELQHRTANNLQNVSALLRQNQSAIRKDPAVAVAVIETAERRFEIMSRINRRLYSPSMQNVEMTPYLEALAQDVLKACGRLDIICIVRPCSIRLQREPAMILSVLIAEMMLNTCKHAFDQGKHGTIIMELAREGNRFKFVFADDGKGLPKNFDFTKSASLGTRIMQGLALQLRGSIRMESDGRGTTVVVTFPAIVDPLNTAPSMSSALPSFNQAE